MGSRETVSHTFEVNRDKIRDLWWVQAMLFGVVFGVVMGLFAAHQSHGSGVADGLVTGSIGGVVFGLAMGWGTRRQQVAREQRTAAVTAGLTAERRTQALRVSRRGPIPDDPAIRAAAAGLARDQLGQSISHRSENLTIFGVGRHPVLTRETSQFSPKLGSHSSSCLRAGVREVPEVCDDPALFSVPSDRFSWRGR